MNERSKKYWQKRQEQKYLAGEKKIDDYYRGLKQSFEQSKKKIQDIINNFYWRYAEENQLSFASAQLKLSKTEIGDLQAFIAKAYENMGKYNQELNNMSIRARVTRYEALLKQIDAQLQQLYAIEYQFKGEELLKEVYSDSYYQNWFNIDQYHGFHQEFAQINAQTINELISYPFDGANFSTRLWKQKDHMLQKLNESITTMLIQGRNPKTLAGEMAKTFGTKEYEAYRLLHTEGSFIMGQGTLAGYREDGVEKYRILATLDVKTSDICREQDGKVYDVDKAVVGVNYWPFHPNCRTTDVPVYEDDDLSGETRVARDPVTGKTYDVPADMTYEQWHEKYIESNPDAVLSEKKWKNRYSDKKQYEQYQKILGNNLDVNSLDGFQNLKYNNPKKWGSLNLAYKDQKLRNRIKSDEIPKEVIIGKQGKHIIGHNNYISGRSYVTISENEIQELVNQYAGTGKIQRDSKGNWINQEIVDFKKTVGVSVDNITSHEKETSMVKIHYSKNGVHIVPYVESR
ncbi:MAG TPA: phage head morphogenesis protein [Lachnospiraceae bacterium]|jgi:SPP1 gp7 family putative phage head morphogenesis protein|nr:phage head morphogenesis protein [Lachnospiraceae bacterium]HCM14029.1 phage head morphogenesis protein [Lachnospiraceae bacterium]HCR40651.1 phage head morphogenesis protein [Lachnospiraceae bacterium]